ncbi:hypothetical protein GCM10008904_31970 [Paraclostridium ghonii]|uniref:NAD-dependent DNA ligase n=1 Tax=Paraclostridium ghonii TaxID=29358 RepID=A0ABU0MXC6_9FIRM|nr:NAD-dependent DNA ligase [Paeniclostridium ghonii]
MVFKVSINDGIINLIQKHKNKKIKKYDKNIFKILGILNFFSKNKIKGFKSKHINIANKKGLKKLNKSFMLDIKIEGLSIAL